MSILKQEQHEAEVMIHGSQHEAGVQSMHKWLMGRQEWINKEWIGLVGEDLIRMQGEARAVARMVKLIEVGPTIKGAA